MNKIIHPIVKAAAEGCCANNNFRGRLCQYHEGYAQGIEDALSIATQCVSDVLFTINNPPADLS